MKGFFFSKHFSGQRSTMGCLVVLFEWLFEQHIRIGNDSLSPQLILNIGKTLSRPKSVLSKTPFSFSKSPENHSKNDFSFSNHNHLWIIQTKHCPPVKSEWTWFWAVADDSLTALNDFHELSNDVFANELADYLVFALENFRNDISLELVRLLRLRQFAHLVQVWKCSFEKSCNLHRPMFAYQFMRWPFPCTTACATVTNSERDDVNKFEKKLPNLSLTATHIECSPETSMLGEARCSSARLE